MALDVLHRSLALEVAGGRGEEADVVGGRREFLVDEGLARLAGVGRFEVGQLLAVLLDRIGKGEQPVRPLAGRGGRPAVLEGGLGRGDRTVYVLDSRER